MKHLIIPRDLSHWNGKKPQGLQFTNSEYGDRWKQRNPEQYLVTIAKSRAKKRGIDFDLTKDDIIIPTHCPILGIELKQNCKTGAGGKDNSYSLDRIDPNLGYIKGNVQVISHKANSMKFTATKEELILFADWVYREYK